MVIYKFDFEHAYDVVAGPTKKEIIDFYLGFTGMGKDDLECAEITKIPKSKWNQSVIVDPENVDYDKPNQNGRDRNGYKILTTFQDYVNEIKEGDCEIIATTAY